MLNFELLRAVYLGAYVSLPRVLRDQRACGRLRFAQAASSYRGARETPSQEVFREGHVNPNLPRFC